MSTISSLCATMVIAAVGALTAASPAAATSYNDTSPGGACHPANGSATNRFSYSNNYLTNIGATDQYVICHFAMNDATASPTHPSLMQINAVAGNVAGTVTCVTQEGSFYSGVNHVESTQSRSNTLAAGTAGYLVWDTTLLTRTHVYNTFTLNCKVPGGFKLGTIEYWN